MINYDYSAYRKEYLPGHIRDPHECKGSHNPVYTSHVDFPNKPRQFSGVGVLEYGLVPGQTQEPLLRQLIARA